jgi:quercetin dioxygenase-like cupin family protein
MSTISLSALAAQQIEAARLAESGRSLAQVYGGKQHRLRQTVIALRADAVLPEHESPGEATLHVLVGEVTLRTATESWKIAAGELHAIPNERHSVEALADSAFLLTVSARDE